MEDVSDEKITLLFSPNPTSDLLHVYVGPGTLPKYSELVVYDLHGRVLQKQATAWADATYLLEVGQLPVGQYYVQLRSPSGQGSVAETFVVVK